MDVKLPLATVMSVLIFLFSWQYHIDALCKTCIFQSLWTNKSTLTLTIASKFCPFICNFLWLWNQNQNQYIWHMCSENLTIPTWWWWRLSWSSSSDLFVGIYTLFGLICIWSDCNGRQNSGWHENLPTHKRGRSKYEYETHINTNTTQIKIQNTHKGERHI